MSLAPAIRNSNIAKNAPKLWKEATDAGADLLKNLDEAGEIVIEFWNKEASSLDSQDVSRLIDQLKKAWD